MTEQFANAASSTLNGGITNVATTMVVTSATGFPSSGNFRCLISAEGANTAEIVTVTSVSGTTFTISRASESYAGSSSASAHGTGATVTQVLTNGGLSQTIVDRAVYPYHVAIEAIEVPFATTGFTTPALLVNQQWYTGSGAQNDFVTYVRLLAGGTWSLALEHYVRTSRGINTISISTDNSTWTDLGTIDSYAASPTSGNGIDTRTTLTGLTVSADGLYYVRIKGATKNASSSAYGLVTIGLWMTRTGA